VRWRTRARHHDVQAKGREHVLADYHLRVGQVTRDTRLPEGCALVEQRLDETQTGEATTATLLNTTRPAEQAKNAPAQEVAGWLGLDPRADGLVAWDVYDAVLSPGDIILMLSWRDHDAAQAFEKTPIPDGTRLRRVRVVRDYGMYDRRENPQYYPDVEPRR
jgi:heme-degrading monooxygenase HmoA